MERDPEMFAALNYIKNKVESLEKIELHRMRNDREMKQQYEQLLMADKELLRIYKSVDGERSQKEIAAVANVTSVQVTRKVPYLVENGLVEIVRVRSDGSKIYKHTVAELAFKLSRLRNDG